MLVTVSEVIAIRLQLVAAANRAVRRVMPLVERARFAPLVVLLMALSAAPADAVETVIDQPVRDGVIAAHGRAVAYSRFDRVTGMYQLRVKVGSSAPRDVPVAPRSVPFDVSVARAYTPVKGHEDVLVYSRCSTEPRGGGGVGPESYWPRSRGCSLRMTTFNGPERRIAGTGEGALPSISGDTLAYARFRDTGPPQVIVRRLSRPAHPVRVLIGSTIAGTTQDVASIATAGDRVAVTWRYSNGDGGVNKLVVISIAAGRRQVVRSLNSGSQTGVAVVGATWLGDGSLQWGEVCAGDPSGCPGRSRYGRWTAGGGVRLTPAPRALRAYATTAAATWTLRSCSPPVSNDEEPGTTCDLVEQTPAPLVPPGT